MIPGFRLLRRLAIGVVILGALFVAANVVAERVAEDKIAQAVQKHFELAVRPTIRIGGFPILLNVVRGDLPEVSFEARNLRVQDLTVALVRVRLDSIHASGLFGGGLRVTVGRGSVLAQVTDAALNVYLKSHGQNATIRLREGQTAVVRATRPLAGRNRKIVATGAVRYARGRFTFTPRTVTVDGQVPPPGFEQEARRRSTLSVALPTLPGKIAIDRVETHAGFARLSAVLKDQRISLG